jgi:hypothetical protein
VRNLLRVDARGRDHLQRYAARDRNGELERVDFADVEIAAEHGLHDRRAVVERGNDRVDSVARKDAGLGAVIRFSGRFDRYRAHSHGDGSRLRGNRSCRSKKAAGDKRHRSGTRDRHVTGLLNAD